MMAIGQQRWDNYDVMAMDGQQHAECLHVLRHPLEATINQCGQFGEEETRKRGDLGG
jgi:hypothetical protein